MNASRKTKKKGTAYSMQSLFQRPAAQSCPSIIAYRSIGSRAGAFFFLPLVAFANSMAL